MEKIKQELSQLLTQELSAIFHIDDKRKLITKTKNDQSLVTEIDFLVSHFLKEKFKNHVLYQNYSYLSEEDQGEFKYPMAVVDPIDGTAELVKGRAECVVSVALMNSSSVADSKNYGWLYNPFSGFSIDSTHAFVPSINYSQQKISGMVSRREFHEGLFEAYQLKENPLIQIIPRGSIAFKLALLASGAIDFVISKAPKNIWDIAAGTILCEQRNISFFVNGIKREILDQHRYEGLLIWARPEQIDELYAYFK